MEKSKTYLIIAFLAVAANQMLFLFDADPATSPNWIAIIVSLLAIFGVEIGAKMLKGDKDNPTS